LKRGKDSGEYLPVRGDSVHGFFTWNLSYMFPMDFAEKKEDPDFTFPPEQKPCLPVQKPPKLKKKRVSKSKKLRIYIDRVCFSSINITARTNHTSRKSLFIRQIQEYKIRKLRKKWGKFLEFIKFGSGE
jgi:hypothetical protein